MQVRKVSVSKRKKQAIVRIVDSKKSVHRTVAFPVGYESIALEGSIGSRIIIGLTDDEPIFDREEWVQNVFSK